MGFFERTPLGRILNRFSSDIASLDTIVPETSYQVVSNMTKVIASMIIMSFTTPYSIIVWILMAVMYLIVQVSLQIILPSEFKRFRDPLNTKHLYNIDTMLVQRRRRWADVVSMLYKCFVFDRERQQHFARVDSRKKVQIWYVRCKFTTGVVGIALTKRTLFPYGINCSTSTATVFYITI